MKRVDLNLARTPFVNRTALFGALAAVLGAALILTLWNAASLWILAGSYRTERKSLAKQERRIAELNQSIAQREMVLKGAGVNEFAGEADFVAGMLASKRFSWLRFLGDMERIKPYGVMFVSIGPSFAKDGTIRLNLRGVANQRDEILKLETNLFGDPAFRDPQLASETRDTANPWTTFQLTCVYVPEAIRDSR